MIPFCEGSALSGNERAERISRVEKTVSRIVEKLASRGFFNDSIPLGSTLG
jgi:hypothetical protein